MRRIVFAALALCVTTMAMAQDTTATTATSAPVSKSSLGITTNDHLMFQLGYLNWLNKPDSINTSGLPRTFNAYFMFAFPFKTNPHFSVGIGVGFATDHMYFDRTNVGIKDVTSKLVFRNLADTTHFKKYKLSTTFLEAPVELRFGSKPDDDKHSVKAALGVKVGTMLSAMVKGKTLEDKNGNAINPYTVKEKSKRFFNTTRLSLTGRIGYGHFSLFGSWS
ncbi:MAG TPA: outer membrane beta-barrel protein, partial [Flavisolibacter sp.]|nr:outer membrane beta-barrel protein [Flavisolibacter sp.]